MSRALLRLQADRGFVVKEPVREPDTPSSQESVVSSNSSNATLDPSNASTVDRYYIEPAKRPVL